jgi:hypothetical protein
VQQDRRRPSTARRTVGWAALVHPRASVRGHSQTIIVSMDVASAHAYVRSVAEQARPSGYHRQDDGTELFGRTPERGSDAWLHIVFAPLTSEEVEALESKLGTAIPKAYREWLGRVNGVSLFADELSLDGLQRASLRDPARQQPYSLITPNVDERLSDASPDAFFIGGYGEDGSLLYIARGGAVHRCARDSAQAVASWGDLPSMLVAEVKRLYRDMM